MRLSTEIWTGTESGDKRVGEIWTDGKNVMYSPDNKTLQRIVDSEVTDWLSGNMDNVVSKNDPINFVQNLPYVYRNHYMWATKVKEG